MAALGMFFCPDTFFFVRYSCLDCGLCWSCVKVIVLEIRFYRVEGRSASVFFPGTPLCLNCRWNCCSLTMDSATLRMWRCSIDCWAGTCGSLVWFVWFTDCKGAVKTRNSFLLWNFFVGSSCCTLAAARVRVPEGKHTGSSMEFSEFVLRVEHRMGSKRKRPCWNYLSFCSL